MEKKGSGKRWFLGIVRIPAGIQGEFYDLINKLSKGEGQVKILNQVY